MIKRIKIIILIGSISGICLSLIAWNFWRSRDLINEIRFRIKHNDATITQNNEIQAILSEFRLLRYNELPEEYKIQTKSDQDPYYNMLKSKSYYVIEGNNIYKKIVGDFRIKDFLPKDQFYKQHVLNENSTAQIFWLVNPKLLMKFNELQIELKNQGFNENGFILVNGYRPPKYNEIKGGAKRSRHLIGEAVDIYIQDINKDGSKNQQDKSIVLDILESKVIGNYGGIGRYPETMSVHFDVRGKKARWDRQ